MNFENPLFEQALKDPVFARQMTQSFFHAMESSVDLKSREETVHFIATHGLKKAIEDFALATEDAITVLRKQKKLRSRGTRLAPETKALLRIANKLPDYLCEGGDAI
jgi:hypothetical protein